MMEVLNRRNFSLLALGLLCLLCYTGSLGNGFMLDDYLVLFNESGVSNKTLAGLFTDYQHIVYRPIGHLPLWLASHCFGTNVVLYHLSNLILFYGAVAMFFLITDDLFKDRRLSLLMAALFAAHPANNMLVNYVTSNILSMFLLTLQLSFFCVNRYIDSGKKIFYWASHIFFVLSLFSHEMSMIYPAYVFCLVYFLKAFDWKRSALFTLPYFGVAGAYFWYRMVFFSLKGAASAVFAVSHIFDAYLSSVMALIYWYLGKMIYPKDIIFLWTAVVEEHYNPFEIYRAVLLLMVLIYLIFVRWKKGLLPFAVAVFIIGLAPVFWASYAHFPFAEPLIEPHWFYFASFGFFLILARGILSLKDKIPAYLFTAVCSSLLIFYFFLLQDNNRHWRSQESYCLFWMSLNQGNATPFYGMGQVALARAQPEEAIGYLGKAYALSRRYHSAFMTADLGYAYFLKGDAAVAREFYKSAVDTEPWYSVTYYYLALLSESEGRREETVNFLRQALARYPARAFYQENLDRLKSDGSILPGTYPLVPRDHRQ